MLDYSEKTKFEPVEAGNYEAKIETAELKKTDAGKKFISVRYLIRKDVNQPNAGRYIFDTIWEVDIHKDPKTGKVIGKDKYDALSPADKAACVTTKEYNPFKIRTLVQAHAYINGNKKVKINIDSF